jgi:uncharacterized protein (DUF1330 family)
MISPAEHKERTMPAAYLIVEMNVTDPERYKAYMAAAPAAVKAAGGEYLVRGGRHETLEGDWQPHRLAMLRFPSYEQAKALYDGAYREVRTHRAGATEYFNLVLVEGVG